MVPLRLPLLLWWIASLPVVALLWRALDPSASSVSDALMSFIALQILAAIPTSPVFSLGAVIAYRRRSS